MNQSVHKVIMAANIGRPLEFDPDTALEEAMNLFWARGYEHTSMQDLLSTMNLSKSSLYQAFGGKQQLFRQCVGRYADQFAGRLRAGLAAAATGRRFIEAFLNSVLEDVNETSEPRGCLVMNTASEFAQSEPEIAQDVARSIERFRAVLQAAVERAQREGDIAPERDARTLANYLVSSMSGLKTQAKAGADAATLKGIIAVVLKALD
ncbi:MAG: TetR/AcrR family transcriptional regulator [Hydrogenophilales bacterium CG15_BIG_FIL_POST_REV_8_21_14_020_62_31]|nr:MAG: TetR/AcrR family transcriptional regulator [Hydrogenophilales bacterium CG15_BIG_FIL_POST_REV_8_21_14_020_62_31]